MKIRNKLRKELERFLSKYPDYEEQGGFLIKNRLGCVTGFLPIPNASQTPRTSYNISDRRKALELANKLAASKNGSVEAFWHNHPDPCIMSAADLSASGSFYSNLKFVTISPISKWGRKYIWYCCEGIKPVELEFI